jgi:xylan 1,4-beta-xylosidase
MMLRTPKARWYGFDRGALTLRPQSAPLGGLGQPAFLGRRQQHAWAEASAAVDFQPQRDGEEAGLAAFQSEAAWYALVVGHADGRRVVQLRRRSRTAEPEGGALLASAPLPATGTVRLKIAARGGRYDFLYAAPGQGWRALTRDENGTILSTRSAGGFVGVTIGPYARAAP